jgi:hypothetical protein
MKTVVKVKLWNTKNSSSLHNDETSSSSLANADAMPPKVFLRQEIFPATLNEPSTNTSRWFL